MRLVIHFGLIDRHNTLIRVWLFKENLDTLLICIENNKVTYDLSLKSSTVRARDIRRNVTNVKYELRSIDKIFFNKKHLVSDTVLCGFP